MPSLSRSGVLRTIAVVFSFLAGSWSFPLAAQEIRLETIASPEPIAVRRIVSLEETSIAIHTADQQRTIPRDELIGLTFPAAPARDLKGNDLLCLTSGDRLQVGNVASQDDAITATLGAAPAVRLTIPLEYTCGLIRLAKGVPGWRERLPVSDDPAVDLVLLRNSDRLRGEFVRLTDEKLLLKTATGETAIEPEDLRALVFSPDLLAKRPIPPRLAVVQFRDGSFWTADSVTRPAGESALYVTVGADRWTIPEEAISRIAFYSPSASSLLALEPAGRRTVPFLPDAPKGPPPASEPKTLPDQDELPTLRGLPVPRGLAGPGRTEWTYPLEGRWTEFRASPAIPDSAGEGGSAVFRVEVDGKPVFESGLLKSGAGTGSVSSVSLTGARTLKLTIDYGEFWDVRNRGVWIDPRLVRHPQPPVKK